MTEETGGTGGAAIDRAVDRETVREFGGAVGALGIMLGSHAVMYYLWIAWRFHGGALPLPDGAADALPFVGRLWQHVVQDAAPTWSAFGIYWAFLGAQALFAVAFPGIRMKGLPIPHEGGRQLEYNVNGIWA